MRPQKTVGTSSRNSKSVEILILGFYPVRDIEHDLERTIACWIEHKYVQLKLKTIGSCGWT